MSPYRIALFFLLAAGLCVVVLLLTPVVHASVIVIHGPMTALRSFRFAALFRWLLRTMLPLGILVPTLGVLGRFAIDSLVDAATVSAASLRAPLRC